MKHFAEIATNAELLWREGGDESYLEIANRAKDRLKDIEQKLQNGFYGRN